MPANGRWDLIRRLKVNIRAARDELFHMDRHDETNNDFSHLKFIFTFQKFQIQKTSDNPLPSLH